MTLQLMKCLYAHDVIDVLPLSAFHQSLFIPLPCYYTYNDFDYTTYLHMSRVTQKKGP